MSFPPPPPGWMPEYSSPEYYIPVHSRVHLRFYTIPDLAEVAHIPMEVDGLPPAPRGLRWGEPIPIMISPGGRWLLGWVQAVRWTPDGYTEEYGVPAVFDLRAEGL